jgi:hypothetical protein
MKLKKSIKKRIKILSNLDHEIMITQQKENQNKL